MLDATTTRRLLGGARTLVGLGAWLAPQSANRVFGLPAGGRSPYATRLFGSRDLLLGAGLLRASGPRGAVMLDLGIAADALDVLAGLDELRRGRLGPWALISVTGGAALFTGLGLSVRAAKDQTRTGGASSSPAATAA